MTPDPIEIPVALTIAGSDSSGGAGIQADLKTFTALGVYGASVITALTAQNTQGVQGIETVTPQFVEAQLRAVLSDLNVRAIKTGMLASAETVLTVARVLREQVLREQVLRDAALRDGILRDGSSGRQNPSIPLVIDPVMVATSGDRLLAPDAVAALKSDLMPLAALVTPNLPEAAVLLGCSQAGSARELEQQARALKKLGAAAVLLKGGHDLRHRPGDQRRSSETNSANRLAVDLYYDGKTMRRFERPWIETQNSHGTGCSLAAAITGMLAAGHDLDDAIARAKDYVWGALDAGKHLSIGKGRGPVDHSFALRKRPNTL